MEMWKQKLGSGATYSNLIQVFENAGHKGLAEVVREIMTVNKALKFKAL